MIKVEDISMELDGSAIILAFADTKTEVPANVKTNRPTIVGLANDIPISGGSCFRTADFELGNVKSDGSVSWA